MAVAVFRAKTISGDVLTVESVSITHNGIFMSADYYIVGGADLVEIYKTSNNSFVEVISGKIITFITDEKGSIIYE